MHKLLLAIFYFSFLIAAGGGGPSPQDSNSILQSLKEFVNIVSEPIISFTLLTILFPFIFPPTDWFDKIHRKSSILASILTLRRPNFAKNENFYNREKMP